MAKRRTTVKKKKKTIPEAIAHIRSSYNNTIITITDMDGNIILWKSAGTEGNKNTKKKTPYAAQKVAEACLTELEGYNTTKLHIQWSKTGPGKDSAIKTLQAKFREDGKELGVLKDATRRSHSQSMKKVPGRR